MMLMNPYTGSVAPVEEWQADFEAMTPEEREIEGVEKFEDFDLIEVVKNACGDWIEA